MLKVCGACHAYARGCYIIALRLLLNIRGMLETPPPSQVDVELTTLMRRESI